MPGNLSLLVLFLLLLTPIRAWAASSEQTGQTPRDVLKTLSLEALGNVEVTSASKKPEEVRRVPAAIFVISTEDIRRSGATSLPEILRLAPGLDVARIDSGQWAIGARGFGDQFSKSVLVLIDGRSVYTPLFAGVFWALEDILLDDIERIEVIRGPGGTVWGANAVNGVVNIITKTAKATPGTRVSLGGGNVDQAIGTVRYGGGNGKALDYRAYAKGFVRGPESHADGIAFDDWRMAQAGFRVDWNRARDSLTFQGDLSNGRDGQKQAITSYSPPGIVISNDPLDVSTGNVLLRWRRALGGAAGNVQVHAYYDRTHFLGPSIGETRHTFDVDFVHHLTPGRRQDVIWGLGARRSPSHIIQTTPTFAFTPPDRANDLYSAFAQDEIEVVDRTLWLTLGSKFERNTYTGVEAQPSARLLWAPADRHSFWTAATRAVRTPSRLEEEVQFTQFATFLPSAVPVFLRLAGNKDFRAEQLVAYEAGYRGSVTPNLYVDVSIFHNDHDFLESYGARSTSVETSPAPPHVVITLPYANGVQGTSNGIEIATDWKANRSWQMKGSYSYKHLDLENKPGTTDPGDFAASYEGSSPRHQVLLQSRVGLPNEWEFDQSWRFVSALPFRQVKSYTAVDVRLSRRFPGHLDWSLVGQNLFDARHVEFALSLGPPVSLKRSVYTSITWRR